MDPLRVYVHDQGIVRIATEPYTTSAASLTNRFIHLTNSSIQSQSPNYFCTDDVSVEGRRAAACGSLCVCVPRSP